MELATSFYVGPTCLVLPSRSPLPVGHATSPLPALALFIPAPLPPLSRLLPSPPFAVLSLFLSYGGAPPNRWTPVAPVTRAAASAWPMEGFRHHRSPGSDRFLGLFAPTPAANGTVVSAGEDELHEDDIFWSGADPPSSEPNLSPMNPSPAAGNPNPSPALARAGFRHLPERNFGILAALPEDDKKPPTPKARPTFLQRKAAAAVGSTSPSSASTSARLIPSVPKPKPEFALSMPGGKIYHQSAPVNVPMAPPKARRGWGKFEMDDGDLDGDEEMLPPHEIVARRSRNGSPMTTFSVLEGVGRTLKGRDLRQVRNAVWRKTGFLD